MKQTTPPILIFARSDDAVMELAEALALLGKGTPIGTLTTKTGPLALRQVIVGMGTGEFPVVVAGPGWATGWRAPLGTIVLLSAGFPPDLAAQAVARAPNKEMFRG